MNISDEIWDYAESKGLTYEVTGGGCDFIYHEGSPSTLGPVPHLIMSSEEDHGMSPDTLDEPSDVGIFLDDDGRTGFTISFNSAREAMDWMASVKITGRQLDIH